MGPNGGLAPGGSRDRSREQIRARTRATPGQRYPCAFAPTIEEMIIGFDVSGSFVAGGEGFESSAVAAATVPAQARVEIGAWTDERRRAWGAGT